MRVIGGAFAAIAKEMAGVLYRMSYSSIIRESEDLGAGIFDRDGNELAESDSTPMFMGAMPKIVKNVIGLLGDDIHDGDVILHNDPYGGATHSPDVAIVIPIFSREARRLRGRLGARARHRRRLPRARDRPRRQLVGRQHLPRGQAAERGVWQEGLWKHILENVRTPTYNNGDIQAMIAACELARRRYLELLGRYGHETVLARRQWLEYSERMLRQEIAKVPDGRYETEVGWLDDDGVNRGMKLPVKVAVEIDGDEITFDLTGSSDEVPTGFNCPFEGTTVSAMTFITRMIFLDEATYPVFVPQNEGMLAPVKVVAPKGSIFNPNYPRACFARFCQVQRAVDLALRALAPVVPDKVTAGNSAHLHFISYSGFLEEEGEYWVYLEVDEGSYGGRPGRDGLDSVDCLIANTRNNPIEELEWRFPMRTERYELRDEPCAAGKWRGGIGMVRVNRFLEDTIVTCEGERHDVDLALGIFGGHDGINAPRQGDRRRRRVEQWPSKFTGQPSGGDASRSPSRTRAATATRSSATPSSSSQTCWTGSRDGAGRAGLRRRHRPGDAGAGRRGNETPARSADPAGLGVAVLTGADGLPCGRCGQHRVQHPVLRDVRLRVRSPAVGEPEAEDELGELVGQRPGVDDRHRQFSTRWAVRLVHGGRAQADDLGAVLDAAHARGDELREDDLLLAAEQVLHVRQDVDRADRRAVGGEPELAHALP